jgi:GTP-binding protein
LSYVIKSAEFITSAVAPGGYPEPGPPEVAFAGRSNVGKSSLINCLVQRKKLVKVSQRPGRTQQINFFDLNQAELFLVDLPGYGFAKVPLSVKASWRRMVEDYLEGRPTLACVVLILDIRREPSGDDRMLMDYLRARGLPTILAVTKADKLSNNKRNARLGKLKPLLSPYDPDFVPVSSVTRLGRDRLWDRIINLAGGLHLEASE